MGTVSFLGVKYCPGVLLTTHPLLVPWSWNSSALPTLWATTGPVTGTLYLYLYLYMKALTDLRESIKFQEKFSGKNYQVLISVNILKYYLIISIQGVTGGTDQTSGECSLGQTIPI